MVTTGRKYALQCRKLIPSWRKWRRMTANQRTWQQWKRHCTDVFNEQRDMHNLTNNGDLNNQANSVTETSMREQMVASLDNLANAVVKKNYTV